MATAALQDFPVLDATDTELLARWTKFRDGDHGPRIGDWVDLLDARPRRIVGLSYGGETDGLLVHLNLAAAPVAPIFFLSDRGVFVGSFAGGGKCVRQADLDLAGVRRGAVRIPHHFEISCRVYRLSDGAAAKGTGMILTLEDELLCRLNRRRVK